MNEQELVSEMRRLGFDGAGFIAPEEIALLPEVRGMCEQNRCGAYGKNWSCPPHCGSLAACEQTLRSFERGLVLMTADKLEDSFDYEGMVAAQQAHQALLERAIERVGAYADRMLPFSPGGCRICETCTCPDAPCRFPDKMHPSMEAYGMMVHTVCEAAGVSYFNGADTVTYVSAIFF